jgi:hypothetical protein
MPCFRNVCRLQVGVNEGQPKCVALLDIAYPVRPVNWRLRIFDQKSLVPITFIRFIIIRSYEGTYISS